MHCRGTKMHSMQILRYQYSVPYNQCKYYTSSPTTGTLLLLPACPEPSNHHAASHRRRKVPARVKFPRSAMGDPDQRPHSKPNGIPEFRLDWAPPTKLFRGGREKKSKTKTEEETDSKFGVRDCNAVECHSCPSPAQPLM